MTVTMKINHQITLTGTPERIQKAIIADLTLPNPAYQSALKQNRSTHGKPKTIELYRFEEGSMIVPRGYGKQLLDHLQDIPYQVVEERLLLPPVEFQSKITPRDYQETAIQELVKHRQGGIVAPCGSGKTVILLEAAARIGQPVLWITHQTELANQTIQRAIDLLGLEPEEIGRIYGGTYTIGKRFTVALVQSLARIEFAEIADKFGAVMIDEAHHIAAQMFFHPIGQFPAMYRLWASATPTRNDGLTKMVYAGGGIILHEINQDDIEHTITPALEIVQTDFDFIGETYIDTVTGMIEDRQRNELIVNTIRKYAPGHFSLVLSERIDHLEILHQALAAAMPDMRIAILHGKLPKKQREAIMQAATRQEIDILLATQLAREGLDIPHLDRLFLTVPKRAAGTVQQEVGRIMRTATGKTDAIVFDFWDSQCPLVKGQFWARREVYRKLGIAVTMPTIAPQRRRREAF